MRGCLPIGQQIILLQYPFYSPLYKFWHNYEKDRHVLCARRHLPGPSGLKHWYVQNISF